VYFLKAKLFKENFLRERMISMSVIAWKKGDGRPKRYPFLYLTPSSLIYGVGSWTFRAFSNDFTIQFLWKKYTVGRNALRFLSLWMVLVRRLNPI